MNDNDFAQDKTIWILKFTNDAGEPIAILMNVAVHSNAEASTGDGMISADVAGVAEAYVEHQFKDKVVALWTMAPCADVYPRLTARSDQSGDADALYTAQKVLGSMVGSAVTEAARQIRQTATVANVAMKAYERVVPCAMNPNSGAPGGGQSRPGGQGAQGTPNAQGGPGGPGGPDGPGGPGGPGGPSGSGGPGGPGDQQQPNLNIPKYPIQPSEKLDIHMSLIRLNQFAIASVSGELSTNLYANLRKVMPLADTLVITLGNNRDGYIPDEANWDHWGNAAFVKGCAEPAILTNIVEMMNTSLQ